MTPVMRCRQLAVSCPTPMAQPWCPTSSKLRARCGAAGLPAPPCTRRSLMPRPPPISMAIARRFSSYTIASFKLRVPLRKVRGQQPLALGFRAHLQQSLPERHIDRQRRCDMIGEGDASLGFKARRVFFVKDAVALVEELLELRGNGGVDAGEIFFEIYDFGFKKNGRASRR